MSSPLQFYRTFKALMAEHGIRHVLTSGMACVEYGIQQNTKDTDWIIEVSDYPALIALLSAKDESGWIVRHRQLFGAPMLEPYMAGGWTCHLVIHDAADSPEHHVDLFGTPPRLEKNAWQADYGGVLNRSALAQMKKTDRAKDWPFINGLALQALEQGDVRGLLHLREPALLQHFVATIPPDALVQMIAERPLLRQVATSDELGLERLLHVEEALWHGINRERYQVYQREWKEFYRHWRDAEPGAWQADESFACQHQRLITAADTYRLPVSPLGTLADRRAAYERGLHRAISLTRATDSEITATLPPMEIILP